MASPFPRGLLDTSTLINLVNGNPPAVLPIETLISSVTLAELSYGVAFAKDPVEVARRSQVYARVRTWLSPLPFDARAAEKYGELAALILASGRHPKARRLDLMIAATAVVANLPLFTGNPDDFRGLESVLTVIPS